MYKNAGLIKRKVQIRNVCENPEDWPLPVLLHKTSSAFGLCSAEGWLEEVISPHGNCYLWLTW